MQTPARGRRPDFILFFIVLVLIAFGTVMIYSSSYMLALQKYGDGYYFLKKHAALMGRESAEISPEALALLEAYSFPGNVRELENIIERAVAIGAGPVVREADLPDDLRSLTIRVFRRRDGRIPTLEEQERDYIRWVLAESNGNQTAAAQALGIDRVSLWRKLKRFEAGP